MVIKTITHFEIPANDIERLKNFYAECFGWKFQDAGMPGMEYWMISTGPRGKSVGGGLMKRMGPSDTPRNYVMVDDIDSAIETFKRAGGTELMSKQEVPKMGWSYMGADPEGNAIGFFQAMMPARRAVKKSKSKSKKSRR
jgi:uncharacterized protein